MDYPVHINDLNAPDPFILADPVSKKYYLYANYFSSGITPKKRAGTGNTFYAMESEDLIHWSNPILVFEQNDFWGSDDYSGPEVYYRGGAYYLIAAFSAPGTLRRIQALKSESPLGPFLPWGEPLSPAAWQVMDGTLFVDRDGETWLLFAHDWVQVYDGQIAAVPVSEDLSHATGRPVVLFRASEAPWGDDFMYNSSKDGGGAASGPFAHRMADGGLVILWSNETPYGDAIGIAKSESGELWGPWIQFEQPVWTPDAKNASLFQRFQDGMLMMHCVSEHNNHCIGKRVRLFEMNEHDGLLETIREVTGQ